MPRWAKSAVTPHTEPFELIFNRGERHSGPVGPRGWPGSTTPGSSAPGYGSTSGGGSGTMRSGAPAGPNHILPDFSTGRTRAGTADPTGRWREPTDTRAGGIRVGAGPKDMAGPPPSPTGSESGPGILESWFNQRAAGIDAASQYATRRGLDALNDRYAAAGMANSGAARQGDSDLLANIEAQRAGQLDALAAGASGEHQRKLDSMFGQGLGLAGGQSGINSAYDLKAAGVQSDALSAALNYFLNKAGVDDKSRQTGLNNILGIWGAAAS